LVKNIHVIFLYLNKMKKVELQNYYERKLRHFKVFFGILLILCLLFGFYLGYIEKSQEDNSLDSFYEKVDIIYKNCNSAMLVKYVGKEGWYVFSPICYADGNCEYNYFKLEDCLTPFENKCNDDSCSPISRIP